MSSAIEVLPVTGVIGAEVRGVDPSEPLDGETVAALRAAWLEHLVLFSRDVDITPEQQIAFAARFGEIQPPHLRSAHDGPPEMNVLDQTDPKGVGADTWHNDSTYAPDPPMGSVLRVVRSPPVGGDTCFANMYAAFEVLSPSMQRHIDGLEAVHDIMPQLVIANEPVATRTSTSSKPAESTRRCATPSCGRIRRPDARRCSSTPTTRLASPRCPRPRAITSSRCSTTT